MRSIFFTLLTLTALLHAVLAQTSIEVIPGVPFSGPSVVQYASQSSLFDAPKVQRLNDTTWDWWYFDAVSPDFDYSIVVVFFTATSESLWPGTTDVGSADYMVVTLTLPDGTTLEAGVVGKEVTVVTVENGSSGIVGNTSSGWVGTPDMKTYTISIDAPEFATTGTIVFTSTAPAHFPCSSDISSAGQRLNLGPTPIFGWLNAMPDADAFVDLDINGTSLSFTGIGYHDKNWGSQPLHTSVNSWYWGHARLGPFSFVWFDFVAPDGTELVSTYLSRDNKVISSTCDGATVRPVGDGAVFPPTPVSSMSEPQGFNITAEVEGEGTLIMQITHKKVLSATPGTTWRWIGQASGGFGNGTTWDGPALYEQFTFSN
ncbi:hypothetical protein NM688_g4907 [Phlebia brevispora]|uniref:Uncharacterized protein n=1 Tax=Phlebia brevispora TaxID=194682 RepID=A0ACC1T1B9_9APHY|nr:hypothetical protein NM688_g4907 [Phlebia brevispora]